MLRIWTKYNREQLEQLSREELMELILSQQQDASKITLPSLDLGAYEQVLDIVEQAILLLDDMGNIIWANKAFGRLTDPPLQRIVQKSIGFYLRRADETAYDSRFLEVSQLENDLLCEFRKSVREWIPVNVQIFHFIHENGELLKWLIIQPSPTYYPQIPPVVLPEIIRQLPISFIYLNEKLEICLIHETSANAIPWGQTLRLSQPLAKLVGGLHYTQILPYLTRALNGERVSCRADWISAENAKLSIEYTLVPHRHSSELPKGFFMFIQHISDPLNEISALNQSAKHIKLALETAQIGIWSVDLKTLELESNEVVHNVYELEKGFFPKTITEWMTMVHPEDRHLLRELYDKSLSAQNEIPKIDAVFRITTGKGELKHIRTIASVRKDNFNEPAFMIGVNLDITEVVKAENQLIEREKLYRTLAENFPNGIIFILDKELRYKFASGAELPLIIRELHQIQSRSIYDIAPPEILGKARENLSQVFEGNTRNFEIKFGKNLNYLISAIPLYDKDGGIPEIMVVSQNITELKKAEERIRKLFIKRYHLNKELKAREEELKKTLDIVLNLNRALSQSQSYQNAILNNTSHAFYLLNPDFQLLTYNRTARRNIKESLGLKIRRGEPFLFYLRDFETEDFKINFQKALSGKIIEDVLEHKSPHSPSSWISYRFAPAFDHQGNIFGVTYSTLDITKAKETEKELIEAKERAEEMIRLKTNFLANMSHEIRTPLNGILGLAQLIAKETDLKQIQEYVALQKESGVRLLNTLTSILNLSRLEAERANLALIPIPINAIIRENSKTLDLLAKSKNIYLIIHTCQHELYCLGDELLLFQILNNIIGNAIKFTKEGHVKVETGIHPDRPGFIYIRVSDTGIGIEETYLDKIFDPFIQESSGQSRNFEGSGLGLPIAKKYVELLGGKIFVKSKKNQGSVFEIILPHYEP